MTRQFYPALAITIMLTLLVGVAYPLVVWGAGNVIAPSQANGSLIKGSGTIIGSKLIGQNFTEAKYLHPRPSAAGSDGYDARSSSGTNLGPNNDTFLQQVKDRAAAYRAENGLPSDTKIPVDAVTASGSGLDPEISIAKARLQATRIAATRHVSLQQVNAIIDDHTRERTAGVLGEAGVNVLEVNLALDALAQ